MLLLYQYRIRFVTQVIQRFNRKTHYVANACWINTLYDFYGDNLLSQEKKRNLITKSIILEILGKTKENIKEGLSISEVLPFFTV